MPYEAYYWHNPSEAGTLMIGYDDSPVLPKTNSNQNVIITRITELATGRNVQLEIGLSPQAEEVLMPWISITQCVDLALLGHISEQTSSIRIIADPQIRATRYLSNQIMRALMNLDLSLERGLTMSF